MKFFALTLLSQLASAAIIITPTTILPTTTSTTTTTPVPTQSQITITSVSYSGNGCPTGSVSTTFAANNTITLGFNNFQAYFGQNYTVADNIKNCQLHLSLQYPRNIQYALVDNTYHGFALLQAGVNGTLSSTYYFSQNAGLTTNTQATLVGGGNLATGQEYTKTDTITANNQIFSPCGGSGTFNINNRISLTGEPNTNAIGALTDDDLTVRMTQQLRLVSRAC